MPIDPERRSAVAMVTLDRRDAMNALSPELREGLTAFFERRTPDFSEI